ncbi:MAG: GGDEF domain-containing protein [Desulfobulbaceae bacterium]|nr:GGDEF domain-containing protein [Desulfobulbaceae bacterium]
MKTEELLEKIMQSDELPTLPTVASKLISLTAREDTTLADIGELVAQDMALSAKILKVCNSAFYSFPQKIGSINQAVSILGINAVRSLVLSFSFLTMKAGKNESRFDFEKFWQRSLASAVSAKLILENVEGADTEQIFISGLLQNIGELILAKTFSEEYDKVLHEVLENQHDTLGAEETVFGLDHTIVGTKVTTNWGFPNVLVEPIRYHHDPHEYKGNNTTLRTTIGAVYLSDLLVNILFSDTPELFHKQFRKEAAKLLKLKPEPIETILDQVHTRVEEAGTYFNLKIKCSKSVQEILQEANIRLSLINLDYDQMNKQLIQAKIHLENLTRELEEKNRTLDNLANLDGLTGVFNHRYFQNALDQEVSRAIRHETELSILLIDIDHFKKFNDTYGHQVGDFVLTEFSQCLQDNIRKYDTLARYGGEEFVIILPETNAEDALLVAEKLRVAVDSASFKDQLEEYHVTASFGHACCKPAVQESFAKDKLINQADLALYDAKDKGRNRVATYVPKKKWFSF